MMDMMIPGTGLNALCNARIDEVSDLNDNMFVQPGSEK
jgi:hypothetical protein